MVTDCEVEWRLDTEVGADHVASRVVCSALEREEEAEPEKEQVGPRT